jgi:phenylacetate-CoA ligase
VGPGEVGEVVITTLDKQASPLLRWRTHDLVRRAERPYACPCGRKAFPLIGRLIGRSDDMLKVRGVIVFPTQVEDVIAGVPGLAKEAWQIYIDGDGASLDQMEVAVERLPSATLSTDALAAEVAARLRTRLGLTVSVSCHADGTLPRYEAKAVRVIKRAAKR